MVFPLYDDNPFKLPVPPIVTWGLIALNILIFLVQISSGPETAAGIVASFAATPATLSGAEPAGGSVPAPLTLLTSMFLHGGWMHIIGNMVYLWVFGDDIEEALGRWRFLVFYLASGVLAALAYTLFNPDSTTPMLGASGAISGVLAAYLMLRPCAKVSVFVFRVVVRVRAYWVIGGWIALQLFSFLSQQADDNVAYDAHFGGLVAGAVLFVLMRPRGVKLFECIQEVSQGEAGPS
jgi:membrane associated rhomboid family serine protease